jgi:hypothetical protein
MSLSLCRQCNLLAGKGQSQRPCPVAPSPAAALGSLSSVALSSAPAPLILAQPGCLMQLSRCDSAQRPGPHKPANLKGLALHPNGNRLESVQSNGYTTVSWSSRIITPLPRDGHRWYRPSMELGFRSLTHTLSRPKCQWRPPNPRLKSRFSSMWCWFAGRQYRIREGFEPQRLCWESQPAGRWTNSAA